MTALSDKKCRPCEGIGTAYNSSEAKKLMPQIPGWQITADGKSIEKEFATKNFSAAVDFVNKIAAIAEDDDHHPDIHLTNYRKLKIVLSTHALKGLTENDFIVAAKINEAPVQLKNS